MSFQPPFTDICRDPRCDNRDDPLREVWYCSTCASCLCDKCWNLSPIHSSLGAARHERLIYKDYVQCLRLQKILNPTTDPTEVEHLHKEDLNTTWFGIGRDEDERPFLQDFEIYSQIMANLPESNQVKYPQLVSFVGETGAGKSTVVNMLIDHAVSAAKPDATVPFPSPVAGSPTNDSTPTSADVHLYCDPAAYTTERTILYADCEGLNAGERTPMGAHSRRIVRLDNSRKGGLRARPLKWAISGETRTRQYAVTQLYPRLLYTFSDVVVFVLKEPKTFGPAVLPHLLDWASALLKASTNQRSLPHAIIALNCSKTRIKGELWNVQDATTNLLQENKHILDSATPCPKLMKKADKWRRKGKRISGILDLIHCYYASFRVVRIPDEQDLPLLSKQVSKLYTTINEQCETAYLRKREAGLLRSADDFGFYIQQAFGHFSENLEDPFDFKKFSLLRNPIPQNLGDHVLRMACTIQDNFPQRSGAWIFRKLSFMVAACFLYDCVTYRQGLPQDLFADYQPNFEKALVQFCNAHWPCEFENNKGRCVNVKKNHGIKGHQNARGKTLYAGEYRAKFTAESWNSEWLRLLKSQLYKLQCELKDLEDIRGELEDPLVPVRKQHLRNTEAFYASMETASESKSGATHFQSHVTCLCCLMRPPEYALRCGHVLCSKCVEAFGLVKKTTIEMKNCPLHPSETRWTPPWKIRRKPDFAGVRILTLDGGGIRGIAELEVLRQLQGILGVNIPIAAFFDLIVGTSTGGIIALALGVKQWNVDKCVAEFKRLCDKAFRPREFHGYPGLQQLTTASHGSKWATTPLHSVLEQSFGKDCLFGGAQDSDTFYAAHVAVTSTNDVASKGIVIANYSRKDVEHQYDFLRQDRPELEMMTWEAAAATSAATPYFKPFEHRKTCATYLDGAFFNNNPVVIGHNERRVLWGDVKKKSPDMFLSLGTSQHREQVLTQLKAESRKRRSRSTAKQSEDAKSKASSKWRYFPSLFRVGKAAYNRFEDALNCERQWEEFVDMVVPSGSSNEERSRYIRINPDIGRTPPSLDAKEEVENLQEVVGEVLRSNHAILYLEQIVFRLVASSFYFEKSKVTRSRTEGTAIVFGRLQCRFEESSEWLRELGRFLKRHQRPGFQPFFDIRTSVQQQSRQRVELTQETIERMRSHGAFEKDEFGVTISTTESEANIRLCFTASSENQYPISGFPRDFLEEDDSKIEEIKPTDEWQPSDDLNGVKTKKEIPGLLNRPSMRLSQRLQPDRETATISSHFRSVSDNDINSQRHLMQEEDRRNSDQFVAKSSTRNSNVPPLRGFSLRAALLTTHTRGRHRPRAGSDDQSDGGSRPVSAEYIEETPVLESSENGPPSPSLSSIRSPVTPSVDYFAQDTAMAMEASLAAQREAQEQQDYELALALSRQYM